MASFAMDKLSYEIFSILESRLLFSPYTSKPVDGTRKVRILSIDGEGRDDDCLLAAVSLVRLESSLRSLSGNPNARIADFFDVAAGSGLGGVLVAMLFTRGPDGNNPLFSAEEALNFLSDNRQRFNDKRGIFRRSANGIFRKIFHEPTTLRDTLKPVLIPCYDLSTGAPFVFSRADAMETDAYDFRMGQVCAATCADRRPVELRSVDRRTKVAAVGTGAAMGNPTAAAITHVMNNKQEFPLVTGAEDLVVLSLGASDGKIGMKTPDMAKIASNAAADTVDQAVAMAFIDRSNYVRIQGNLGYKNIESVLFRGRRISEKTNAEKLEEISRKLVNEQQRRMSSPIPTVMIKQQTASPRTSSATTCTTVTNITTSTNESC